jgi:WD40 repeat protein
MKNISTLNRLPLLLCLLLFASVICDAQRPELTVQTGHNGWVESVAISPDSKVLASGSDDKTIKLWDIATGAQLRSLEGHTSAVFSVAFSPDGKTLASSSDDKTIRLWNVATGAQLRALEGHTHDVRSVAFSPDGKTLASGSDDKTIKLWDVATGMQLRSLDGHSDRIFSVAFSPDGKTLASSSDDKTIRLWDVATGTQLRALEAHTSLVRSVAFSPDGKTLASSDDETIRLWDVATGTQLRALEGHTFIVNSVAFSPDGKTLASGGDTKIKLWDIATSAQLRSLEGHTSYVSSVAFSPDGKTLASGSADNRIKLWNVATGIQLHSLERHTDTVESVAFSPDGKTLASGVGTKIKLWDVTTGTQLRSLEGHAYIVNSVAFSPDGKTLASGGGDLKASVKLWDVATGAQLHSLKGHTSVVESVAFSPDGKTLASGSDDKTIRLWDVATGMQLRSLEAHTSVVESVAFSPDGKTLASGSADKTIKLWDVATGTQLRSLEAHSNWVSLVAFSPDGKTLVSGGDTKIKLWDVATGTQLRALDGYTSYVRSIAISPDGKTLASGSFDKTIKLWDVATGTRLHSLEGHTSDVVSVAFSSDGKTLASGGDTKIKLWNTKSGQELASLIALDKADWAVVTRDGRYDASPAAMELMHWVVGLEVISLNQLKVRYYEPNLLPKLLGYNKEPLRDISAFTNVKLPPTVAYEPPPGSTKLTLKLTDRGGGIGRVQVFVNDKEIATDARGLDKRAPKPTLTVDLAGAPYIAGQPNEIRVVTWNAEGYISSRGEVREWTPTGTAKTNDPQFYAIVVGVSNYSSPDIKLRFPDKDAADIAHALEIGAKRLFGAEGVHVTLFNTSGVERAIVPRKVNLKKAFEEVAHKARPWDIFVVYLSGHGTGLPNSDSYFYLTQDARNFNDLADPEVRKQITISSDELTDWIKQIPALKQIMVLDTCAAGQAAVKLVEQRAVSGDQIRAIERLKDRTGFHVLMGSAADAVSWEASKYGQGLLTYALLQGIRGAALRDGEFVDVSTLFQYAADQVPRFAQNIGGIQRPIIAAPRGTSFDIGRLDKGDKEAIPLALVKPLILRPILINPDEGTDNLNLMPALRKSLNEDSFIESRGLFSNRNSQTMLYVDADELPGAARPSGTYIVAGQKVSVRLFLTRDGQKVGPLQVEGTTDDQTMLVARITKAIKEAVRQMKPNGSH